MIFLGLFIIAVCVISYLRKRQSKQQQAVTEMFWERENAANQVRRKDISGLPYINIPLENFPIGICKNNELTEYENTLKELAQLQILNLTGKTNTDLKLEYGAANLPFLTECDQNFSTLCQTVAAYGECLMKLGYESEAKTVLEFGISCGSDISKNFLLLADIYQKNGSTKKLEELKGHANNLDSLMKKSILQHLEGFS